jgi:hypothetical protein
MLELLHEKCGSGNSVSFANESGFAAMKEGGEKWNTKINLKWCIILKDEGYCTVTLNSHILNTINFFLFSLFL